MIRILYMSDLHLEMERPRLWARRKPLGAHPVRGPLLKDLGAVDLVVLAGDIHNGLRGIVYAEQVAAYLNAPVVYVAGNHEFYHHDMQTLLPALRRAAAKTNGQVQFLDNDVARFTFHGVRVNVLGCTLWTDYALHGTQVMSMVAALGRMNDHRFIHNGEEKFLPHDALARHMASRVWLEETLAALRRDEPESRNVVVSHHAPSGAALGDRHGGIAPAYATELTAAFAPFEPAGWIHGHTHFRHSSRLDGIEVVSAPRGYVGYDRGAIDYVAGVLEV